MSIIFTLPVIFFVSFYYAAVIPDLSHLQADHLRTTVPVGRSVLHRINYNPMQLLHLLCKQQ
jgi:hypothetical protein